MKNRQFEPGSFRDRESAIYYQKDSVYRLLKANAFTHFKKLKASKLYEQVKTKIVETEEVKLAPADKKHWAGLLKHRRLEFISYPYEWCFSQLKDAALLTLDLMKSALEHGFLLKDASAYNIQFDGSKPVFIDIASFEEINQGGLWPGYGQFCQMFLYPLMLTSLTGASFQPELRGLLDGIDSARIWQLLGRKGLLKRGVFAHVYLQAKAQKKYADKPFLAQNQIKSAEIGRVIMQNTVRSLFRATKAQKWHSVDSEWASYAQTHSYSHEEQAAKETFIRQCLKNKKAKLAYDLGCNTGHYSRIAAQFANKVVAVDGDHLAIERLYFALKNEGNEQILPLVMNLADESPARGWRGQERQAFFDRAKPDFILALALIHHMVIGSNIPLDQVVGWLANAGGDLIIEFIDKDDKMVQKLLATRPDIFVDYEQKLFEYALKKHYRIAKIERLPKATRTMYYCVRKGRR